MQTNEPVRLEKTEGKHTLYVVFNPEARNCVVRHWNIIKDGRSESKTERENFQSVDDVKTYLENQVADYEKHGFKRLQKAETAQTKSEANIGADSLEP